MHTQSLNANLALICVRDVMRLFKLLRKLLLGEGEQKTKQSHKIKHTGTKGCGNSVWKMKLISVLSTYKFALCCLSSGLRLEFCDVRNGLDCLGQYLL